LAAVVTGVIEVIMVPLLLMTEAAVGARVTVRAGGLNEFGMRSDASAAPTNDARVTQKTIWMAASKLLTIAPLACATLPEALLMTWMPPP